MLDSHNPFRVFRKSCDKEVVPMGLEFEGGLFGSAATRQCVVTGKDKARPLGELSVSDLEPLR